MTMQSSYAITAQKYEVAKDPYRLAVGDVIRCPAFRLGHRPKKSSMPPLPQLGSEGEVHAAWREESRLRHYVTWVNTSNWGKDSIDYAIDESRGTALFLVTYIVLDETCGPEDVGAGFQIYRVVGCSRLTGDIGGASLQPNAERIQFIMDDPFASCSPPSNSIEVVGFALPISGDWICASTPTPQAPKRTSKKRKPPKS